MAKIYARNTTNRTIEFYVPGGRLIRLAPRVPTVVTKADCNSPKFKRLMRQSLVITFTSTDRRRAERRATIGMANLKKKVTKARRKFASEAKAASKTKNKRKGKVAIRSKSGSQGRRGGKEAPARPEESAPAEAGREHAEDHPDS